MSNKLEIFIILMILFQIKHYLSDFLFQNTYMVEKKGSPGWDFALPLLLHSSVHGVQTLLIVFYFAPQLWYLALFDTGIHFMIDRLKSGPRYFGRFNDPSTAVFWNILGLDQTLHHLVHIYIAFLLVQ